MSQKGKLPAVSRVELKGYTLLKFFLMTLSAPKCLVRSGEAPAAFASLCSWLLVSAVLVWNMDIRKGGAGRNGNTNFGEHPIEGLDSRVTAGLQYENGLP